MDSLNFFFGLKAVSTPYVSDMPISETTIGNMSKQETFKEATLGMELLKEEKATLINPEEKHPVDFSVSDGIISGGY